jgi:hypothetical protein
MTRRPGVLVLLVAACTPAASRPPDGGGREETSHEREVVLAWIRQPDGATETLRLDRDGTVLGRHPEIRIATSTGEWIWRTAEIAVPTAPCPSAPPDEAGPDAARPGRAMRATLERADGRAAQSIVAPGRPPPDTSELLHEVRLVGSVGAKLFVEESSYVYACGAHGMTTVTFRVWDAVRGAEIDVLRDLPDLDRLTARAHAQLAEPEDDSAEAPELTAVIPRFGPDRVRFEAQLTAPTCYACSDGVWSSYTRSVRLPTAPPPVLGSDAELPYAVKRFVRELGRSRTREDPSVELGGWSRRAP